MRDYFKNIITYKKNIIFIIRIDSKFEEWPRSIVGKTHRYRISLLYPIYAKSRMRVLRIYIINKSYPKGNFEGNQLLNGSISLSPLYTDYDGNDLHVSSVQRKLPTNFHLSLLCLYIIHHLSGLNRI